MAQKTVQTQALHQTQTLSPQQVLQVRLLEMPLSALEQRVNNELMENGALEERVDYDETSDFNEPAEDYADGQTGGDEVSLYEDNVRSGELKSALDDYRSPDDVPDYLLNAYTPKDAPARMEYSDTISFYGQMQEQMSECELTDRERELMDYLIGSLDSDGLLRKRLSVIADELAIYNNVETTEEELEAVLLKLQQFDPAGVGARDLRECLLLQIRRSEKWNTPLVQQEYRVIDKYYDDFMRKRWDRIQQRMHLTDGETERLQKELRRLNPRPGSAMGEVAGHNYQQIIPDFIVETDDEGQVTMSLNRGNVPELHISPSFMEILKRNEGEKPVIGRAEREALQYTRQKVEKARSFIEAVKLRRQTMTVTMQAIIDLQMPFFREGDETLLKPMILKDVAERTGLDISTVSRVTGSKYVETNYGIYPLKWFFSDGYVTEDGQEIAVRKIQAALKALVDAEDRKSPLSDEALTAMLNEKGFPIARRTVAKYREQLGIPVARLRK